MSNIWLLFATQYNSSLSSFVPNFRILTLVVAEKSLTEKKFTNGNKKSATEFFIGEKEKWINKGTDKQYVAVFDYTIQLITLKLCTKYQNPNSSSCWEIFDRKKMSICII